MPDAVEEPAPWVLCDGRRRTHAVIRARAACAASGFRSLGIAEGDSVALLLGNGLPFVEASLAAAQVGAFPVPINRHAVPEDITYILRDCGAKLLVAEHGLVAPLRGSLPRDLALLVVDPGEEIDLWETWVGRHPPLTAEPATTRGAVIYTSGSTGRPKGVRRAPARGKPVRALRVYGFDQPGRATALVDGPLYHAVPNTFLRLAFGAGADIVLRPFFEPEAMLAAISRHRVSHLHIVPAMMTRLLALPAEVRARHDLSSLRHVVHGAAPCAPHLKRAMIDWWGPVLHEYYGSTETGLLTLLEPGEALAKPGSVGRALPGIALHVLDPGGNPVPAGAVGTVYAGSETLHDFTYMGQDDRRAAVGRGDLVTAGDLGRIDRDGFLHLCGRARDVVMVGGRAVYPAEVEAAVLALPGVLDAAVFGLADPSGDDVLCACVSGDRPLDPEALRDALSRCLAPAQVPRRFRILDRLPREDSGKIFKDRLHPLFRSGEPG